MSVNPFPGLRPFEFEESTLFFGRDGQSEELIVRLGRNRFVAVVGASGSGKSSLVRAGLLPELLGGSMTKAGSHWRLAIMRPGHDPLGNLARAIDSAVAAGGSKENRTVQAALTEATLRRGGLGLVNAVRQAGLDAHVPVLIVVDQFEEIFRFARASGDDAYQNESAAFVKLILEATRSREVPIFVVLTMRSDFLGECSLFWGLPEAVNDSQYLIPRLTRDQLREAITGPVAVGGAAITPRLVSRLLNDAGDDPDQLPILQHALMRTWDEARRGPDQGPLDLPHYEAIGSMAEALSIHADEAFGDLPTERSREVAEKLFKRLTGKELDNRGVRRPSTITEICAASGATRAEAVEVIETFRQPGRSFLVPPAGIALDGESLIDISHESLIRGWKRLRSWVDDEAESARIYRRLAETALLHVSGRAALWGDPDLQVALDWRDKNHPNAVWADRYAAGFEKAMPFLDASAAQRADNLAEQERRQTAEVERTRRELAQAQELAEVQRQHAEGQRLRLEEQARSAVRLRRRLTASLVLGCLALAAAVLVLFLYRRAEADRKTAELERTHADEARNLADAKTREARAATDVAERQKQWAELSAEVALAGQLAAQSDQLRGGAPRLFMQSLLLAIEAHRRYPGEKSDLALRASLALAPVPGPRLETQGLVEAVALSPDGRYAFVASRDKTLRVFDRASGRELAQFVHRWGVNAIALNADVSLVASGSGDPPHDVQNGGIISQSEQTAGEARVWDWRAKREMARVAFAAPVRLIHFVGAREMIAAADLTSLKTAAFDRKGGVEVRELRASTNDTTISSFSDDGTLAAVHHPAEVEIVDLVSGSVTTRVKITSSEQDVIFSPDNTRVAITGDYGDTRVLDLASGKVIAQRGAATRTAFSPDGKLLAQIDRDGNARVWTLDDQANVGVMSRGELLSGTVIDLAAFLPGSTAVVTTLDDAVVRVWQPSKTIYSGELGFFELFRAAENKVTAINVSRDGKLVVEGDGSGARVWELQSGREAKRWLGASEFAFGSRYALTAAGRDLRVIDTKSDAQVATGARPDLFRLSPDESRFATAANGAVEFRRLPGLALLRRVDIGKDIKSMAFSGDGRSLAVAWGIGTVTEIDVDGQGRVDRVKSSQDVSEMAISPHAGYFLMRRNTPAAGYPADSIDVYERSGRKIASIPTRAFSSRMGIAPNEAFFAAQIDDKTLGVWNLATGEVLLRIPLGERFSVFAISPDSRYVAVSVGPQITVWDVAARKPARTFDHFSTVGNMAFSPDSRSLLANCDTLRVWSMEDGELKSVINGDDYDDRSSFTPDGKYIVSQKDLRTGGATPHLSFKVWRPEDLIAEGCRRATRNLTDTEWRQYLRTEPVRKTCPDRP